MTQLHAIRTFYDSRMGLVTLDNDVLGIVSQVRQLFDGKITVHLDDDSGDYYFVEHREDHTEKLIFTTAELDGRCIERLLQADSQSRSYQDPYELQEREQDRLQAEADEQYKEKLREHGEELVHALKRGGAAPRLPAQVSLYVPAKAEKAAEKHA